MADEIEGEAEQWLLTFIEERFAIEANPDPDLTSILAGEDVPDRFREYFAKRAMAADIDLLLKFAKRFGSTSLAAAIEAMKAEDREFAVRVFESARKHAEDF